MKEIVIGKTLLPAITITNGFIAGISKSFVQGKG
jgi:hypothetical protein